MERAEQVIRRGDTQFLIHPEGTRTRNGEMGSFKKGVASLSMDTGVPIVPVCITGAYEIYPAGTILPKFYDFKNHRKPRLKIAFGAPIMPAPDAALRNCPRATASSIWPKNCWSYSTNSGSSAAISWAMPSVAWLDWRWPRCSHSA